MKKNSRPAPLFGGGQIDTLLGASELLGALSLDGSDAPRSYVRAPGPLLGRIRKLAPLTGITRLGDISFLSPTDYPVFQAARPFVHTHADVGQTTGGQGKGSGRARARLGALMETIEAFSYEPRHARLVRASYNSLRRSHLALDPRLLTASDSVRRRPVTGTEPLMWTEAASLESNSTLYIPAETVFFPFFPRDYATRSLFPASSNGLGAGSSYVHAVVQGIYELIERHYTVRLEEGAAISDVLLDRDVKSLEMDRIRRKLPEFDVQLHATRFRKGPGLPMVNCYLVGNEEIFFGSGCHADPDTAIQKALSEALQVFSTWASGAREDLPGRSAEASEGDADRELAQGGELSLAEFRRRHPRVRFRTAGDELRHLLAWLRRAGFRHTLVANLTRVGIGIPVVKVLIPGMDLHSRALAGSDWTSNDVRSRQFRFRFAGARP